MNKKTEKKVRSRFESVTHSLIMNNVHPNVAISTLETEVSLAKKVHKISNEEASDLLYEYYRKYDIVNN